MFGTVGVGGTMRCVRCGAINQAGAAYCNACGLFLQQQQPQGMNGPAAPPGWAPSMHPQGAPVASVSRRRPVWPLVLGIGGLALALAIGGFVWATGLLGRSAPGASLPIPPQLLPDSGAGTVMSVPPMPTTPVPLWSPGEGGIPFVASGDPGDAGLAFVAVRGGENGPGSLVAFDTKARRRSWSTILDGQEDCEGAYQPNRILCRSGAAITVYEARSGSVVARYSGGGTFGDSVRLLPGDEVVVSHCAERTRDSTTKPLTCTLERQRPGGAIAWRRSVTLSTTQWYMDLIVFGDVLLAGYDTAAQGVHFQYEALDTRTGQPTEIPEHVLLGPAGKDQLTIIKDGVTTVHDRTGKKIGTVEGQPRLVGLDPHGRIQSFVGAVDSSAFTVYRADGTKRATVPNEEPLIVCGDVIVSRPSGLASTLRIGRDADGKEKWRTNLTQASSSPNVTCDGVRVIESDWHQDTGKTDVAMLSAYSERGVEWTYTAQFPGADSVDFRPLVGVGIGANGHSSTKYLNNWKSDVLGVQ